VTRFEMRAEGERQTQMYLGRTPEAGASPARWETLSFDIAGRLTQRTHPGCAEKLIYEGQLLKRLESCGSQQHFERDAFGLITEHRQELGGKSFSERYRYDAAGRRHFSKFCSVGHCVSFLDFCDTTLK
jgi:hypothetical protein